VCVNVCVCVCVRECVRACVGWWKCVGYCWYDCGLVCAYSCVCLCVFLLMFLCVLAFDKKGLYCQHAFLSNVSFLLWHLFGIAFITDFAYVVLYA
jgi:hypothetical protein